jgi:UDP-N-acetylmuramoylalanine--D-glutamate ligase
MKPDWNLQGLRCLALAVAGTNGKSTTSLLLERMLQHNQRRTAIFRPYDQPATPMLKQSGDLDFLIVQLDSLQLRNAESFRPAVAVLLSLAPDHLDEYGEQETYIRAHAPLFEHQQFFDWAIVQSQALGALRQCNLPVSAKIITFSASDASADLFVDRGLLVSRLPNWSGPLLDLDHCLLRGPHNAENLLATLAVGHVLRLGLDRMLDAIKTFHAGPHRCELVAEINGVQFINDSKASNLDAMENALRTVRSHPDHEPNVWLIAGGTDAGQDFHATGPLLSRKVKGAFLIGEVGPIIQSAWSLFTPCMLAASLLEAVAEAARNATPGDVILLSPACSGLDQFRNHQHRGQVFCEAVKSIGRGELASSPYMHGVPVPAWS